MNSKTIGLAFLLLTTNLHAASPITGSFSTGYDAAYIQGNPRNSWSNYWSKIPNGFTVTTILSGSNYCASTIVTSNANGYSSTSGCTSTNFCIFHLPGYADTFGISVHYDSLQLTVSNSIPLDYVASADDEYDALRIPQNTPTLTWSDPAPIIYGTPLSQVQLNASASVPGIFVYTPPASTILNVGVNTLSVYFIPSDTSTYATATASVSLVVNPIPTVTVSGYVYCSCDNSSVSGVTVQIGSLSGTTDSSGSYTISGISPGTYPITVSGPNYYTIIPPMTIPSQSFPITSDFTLTPSSSSVTGHVYCSCDNSPVSGVTVKIGRSGQYSAITDSSGSYSISCIPANTYSVTVSGPNYDTVLPPITISSPCSSIKSDVLLGLPADALAKSLIFPISLDGQGRPSWEMLAKFTPANGMSLKQAACVLGVDHFNWIQTISHPIYVHYFFAPIDFLPPQLDLDFGLITTVIPDIQPITDPCPVLGARYVIRSDLPAAFHCEILAPDANGDDIGDGSGFYWSDGAEVNSWHRDNEHSLVFKDTPKLPSGFLAAGDGQQFVTRLVGVKQGGGCAFIGHLTGFTWHSDAVCDPQGAILAGHVYGIYSLKETNDFSAVPVISGGVTNRV